MECGVTIKIEADFDANVLSVVVELGSEVNAGDLLVILESMKMEIPVVAPISGTVTEIYVQERGLVKGGQAIAAIVEHSAQAPS